MHQIIEMIEILIKKDVAYAVDNGDVYFSIEKFPDYGQLSNKKLDELLVGARVEASQIKKNPMDFVLWKSAKEGEASWPSPWGEGRPGWHIECSAMSTHCLGNTFDIHGGGPDLKFPHHENEIAQSEAATGQKFVNCWMHAGAVRVNKEKMSKSLGNFFTIRDVMEKYDPEVIRYFLISSHYRSQVDYSEDSLHEAVAALGRLYNAMRGEPLTEVGLVESYEQRFQDAMNDDFNTPLALSVLFELVKDINKAKSDSSPVLPALLATLKSLGGVLGILQNSAEDYFTKSTDQNAISESEILALIEKRNQARAEKNWAESDRVRDELKDRGVVLDDSKAGTSWRRA
jgi:cysteinyl-tRNA synthetase